MYGGSLCGGSDKRWGEATEWWSWAYCRSYHQEKNRQMIILLSTSTGAKCFLKKQGRPSKSNALIWRRFQVWSLPMRLRSLMMRAKTRMYFVPWLHDLTTPAHQMWVIAPSYWSKRVQHKQARGSLHVDHTWCSWHWRMWRLEMSWRWTTWAGLLTSRAVRLWM